MSHRAIATLTRTLPGHVGLGECRLDTLCMLVVGIVAARTVNLGHIATAAGDRLSRRPTAACSGSSNMSISTPTRPRRSSRG